MTPQNRRWIGDLALVLGSTIAVLFAVLDDGLGLGCLMARAMSR
jgi:hypothetical protein